MSMLLGEWITVYFPHLEYLGTTTMSTIYTVFDMCVYGDLFFVFSSTKDYITWAQTKHMQYVAFIGMVDRHDLYGTAHIHILRKEKYHD